MKSWGVCSDCGRDLMLAEEDKQRFRCPRCKNTVSVEEIVAYEKASKYCHRRDIDQFWDITPGMVAATENIESL